MAAPTTDAEARVKTASGHLYEAFTHKFGPLDLGPHQPIVKAISEFGQRSREADDEAIHKAGEHIYEAMTHHFGKIDLGAHDPLIIAIAEFGKACRGAGVHAAK